MKPRRKRKKIIKNYTLALIGASTLLLGVSLLTVLFLLAKSQKKATYNRSILSSCKNLEKGLQSSRLKKINVKDKGTLRGKSNLQGTISSSNAEKYRFTPQQSRKLNYKTSDPIQVCVYDNQNHLLTDNKLNPSLRYSIFVITQKAELSYSLQFNLQKIQKEAALELNSNDQKNPDYQESPINNQNLLLRNSYYNVQNKPNLSQSDQLQIIVDRIIAICDRSDLPTNNLSITLINVNDRTLAQYQGDVSRYPASIAKLFWLVILYSYVEEGIINLDNQLSSSINKMMAKSDNEAASYIIDKITKTQSGAVSSNEQFKNWHNKRNQLNYFFNEANYDNLNITQKNFPIPYLEEYGKRPKGLESKMRYLENRKKNNPIRNKLKTWHAARLMYEIVTNRAISKKYSQKIQGHLERDLNPKAWKSINPRFEFNPVQAFFGEGLQGLPTNVRLLSKAGWTSSTRQEVAYVETPDQKTRYILAIFVENKAYAQNRDIFPKLSKFVFEQMSQSTN